MKTRVIFGLSGAAFVLLAVFVFPSIVVELLVAAICALAGYELLAPTGLVKNKLFLLFSMLSGVALTLVQSSLWPFEAEAGIQLVLLLLLVGLFSASLRFYQSMEITQVAWSFVGGFVLPYLLDSLIRIYQMEQGRFLLLLPLFAAWGSDSCALFAGKLFGRRKLAPVISPKKTVEGAIGGALGGMLMTWTVSALYRLWLPEFALPHWAALLLGGVGAFIGELGDLSFSVIKRQTGIKDYGWIFPGHGGVLDRFDSVLFVAPLAEVIFRIAL